MRRSDTVRGIEGENDFSGKRYVWLKDPQAAFVKGWVVEELGSGRILVQCDDGTVRLVLWINRTITPLKDGRLNNTMTDHTYSIATRSRLRKRRQGQPGQVRQGRGHG